MATTPARLGQVHRANAIGFQIAAAALGQALLPATLGAVAARSGLESIGLVLLTLALFLLTLALFLFGAHEMLERASARPRPSETLAQPAKAKM